ncbi:hypothetical protein BU24DRAFT_258603 [Aaosphaeria arxii CBS 175.79]|uniref:F-box domain-containing protein n=1 Tax=Aaosphaeria arxii CBS 175.79 TaxID=1450172 RepID=A0A6A5XIX1_9PLEO|nr:uncharacterized protein BU24DRAFT_258603 [Aaosphaeria arxii CBS 175.79]KAF2012781.1 hypothetical protein BU24DRAFT_258603 [Aaosphaeria arxii CBS 175.79]
MEASPPTASELIDLAPELLELVLSYLNPAELVAFGTTCRRAHAFVHPSNQILWRSAFLQKFDDPKYAWARLAHTARTQNMAREMDWSWFEEVRKRYQAIQAVRQATTSPASSTSATDCSTETIVKTLLDIVATASHTKARTGATSAAAANRSLNLDLLNSLFLSSAESEALVHDYHRTVDLDASSLLDVMTELSNRPITRSMLGRTVAVPVWASQFHIFYGMTVREKESLRSKSLARAIVYNWLVTGSDADHGPFKRDKSGTVNWQALEAVTSLMHRIFENTRRAHSYCRPWGFRKNVTHYLPSSVSSGDWAGVNRIWVGTYAFLDYRALVHYNFANRVEHPMDLGQYEEACGDLMQLQLEISDSEELKADSRLQSDLPYCKDLPRLYFTGATSNRPNGRLPILVKGFVCLVPGAKQVRWRFVIRYAGSDQWQLEGVQPGGIRSGGVYGLWSHVDHEANGPIGPFCYFPSEACEPSETVC